MEDMAATGQLSVVSPALEALEESERRAKDFLRNVAMKKSNG
jgi:hypothetical protein